MGNTRELDTPPVFPIIRYFPHQIKEPDREPPSQVYREDPTRIRLRPGLRPPALRCSQNKQELITNDKPPRSTGREKPDRLPNDRGLRPPHSPLPTAALGLPAARV